MLSRGNECKKNTQWNKKIGKSGDFRFLQVWGVRLKNGLKVASDANMHLDGVNHEIELTAKAKKINDEKTMEAEFRSETQPTRRGVKRKKFRRSTRIQRKIPPLGLDTKEVKKPQCAACDSMISHKVMKNGVVKCTKCTNRFHPLCTGIQEG